MSKHKDGLYGCASNAADNESIILVLIVPMQLILSPF